MPAEPESRAESRNSKPYALSSTLSTAEALLLGLAMLKRRLEKAEKQAQQDLEKLKAKWGPLLKMDKEQVKDREKDLVRFMKANKGELFEGTDKVSCKSGVLLYEKADKVHLPRDVVARIQEQGEAFEDGIEWTPALNRPVVEGWPDDKLLVIGGERKPEESFSYELTASPEQRAETLSSMHYPLS